MCVQFFMFFKNLSILTCHVCFQPNTLNLRGSCERRVTSPEKIIFLAAKEIDKD